MGDFNALFIFTEFHQTFSNVDGFLPFAGCLINLQQLLQGADAKIGLIHQLFEHLFSAIVQTGGHIVAAKLLYGQQTLLIG